MIVSVASTIRMHIVKKRILLIFDKNKIKMNTNKDVMSIIDSEKQLDVESTIILLRFQTSKQIYGSTI